MFTPALYPDPKTNQPTRDSRLPSDTNALESAPPNHSPASLPANLDENLLRQIIREELSLQLPTYLAGDLAENLAESTPPKEISQRRAARQYSKYEIEMSIDQLKGTGAVSPRDMHALEAKIITLDKSERLQMMGKLMAAMNAGEIKGRFQ